MQLAWSRVWTRVAVSISYNDNHYTPGTSQWIGSSFMKVLNWMKWQIMLKLTNKKRHYKHIILYGKENFKIKIGLCLYFRWLYPSVVCYNIKQIVCENNSICEGHKSTKRAGANNIILLPENVNRMMGLWIRITLTVFTGPLLKVSVQETFLASQEFSGPRVIRELPGQT